MRFSVAIFWLMPLSVHASPVSDPKALNDLFCKINNIVLSALSKNAAATTYCSSFLSISTKSFSTTVTRTPVNVRVTVPVTSTGQPAIVTSQTTITLTAQSASTTTTTSTTVTTTTSTTSTSTITCLNSAYTRTQPTGVARAAARHEPRGAPVPKPTIIPAQWPSAYISTACSCLSIPTPSVTSTATQTLAPGTVTVISTILVNPKVTTILTNIITAKNTNVVTETTTSTSTATAYAVETTIASNGIRYRKYTHPFDATNPNSGFTSTYFKSPTSDFSGSLTSLTFSTPDWPDGGTVLTLADGHSFEAGQAAILLQGFFIAQETGTYTFASNADDVDNWAYLWVGDVAYSAWNDGNTSFKSSRTADGNTSGQYTVTLKAGDAIPLTLLWSNGTGQSQNRILIQTPSGQKKYSHEGLFVQACSASVFP